MNTSIIMYECLLEIGFEAEINTKEDPELKELAEELCNEYQDTRAAAITALRKMIFDRRECFPYRTDDEFLLRFLRMKNFIVPRAHKQLVRYCTFREQYKYIHEGVDLWSLCKLNDVFSGTMLDRPDIGRISVIRFGEWDTNDYPVEDVIRAAYAIAEIGIRQPKLQVIGSTVIIDLEKLSMKHVANLTPSIAYQIVCLMGLAMPGKLRACHIINYSWILHTFFYLFKRFIPRNAWDLIHFHGNDFKSLHKHLDLECLPVRYGGTCRSHANVNVWLKKIRKYRDAEFDNDMKLLGFVIKE